MKLKCNKHNRRIFAHEGAFHHRDKTLQACDSRLATIGTQTISASDWALIPMLNTVKNAKNRNGEDVG